MGTLGPGVYARSYKKGVLGRPVKTFRPKQDIF